MGLKNVTMETDEQVNIVSPEVQKIKMFILIYVGSMIEDTLILNSPSRGCPRLACLYDLVGGVGGDVSGVELIEILIWQSA